MKPIIYPLSVNFLVFPMGTDNVLCEIGTEMLYVRLTVSFTGLRELVLTFIGPCIVIYFYSKTKEMHQFFQIYFIL